MTAGAAYPDSVGPCRVAFKEWAEVCKALDAGEQTILVRKGGIAEEGGLFVPDQPVFWLYPTLVHQAEQGMAAAAAQSGFVEIRNLARVEVAHFVDRPELLPALARLQALPREILENRFHYRRPGLWVLGVRIFRSPATWALARTPEQAGCKTWVSLPEPIPTEGLIPVLTDDAFTEALARVAAAVGSEAVPLAEDAS